MEYFNKLHCKFCGKFCAKLILYKIALVIRNGIITIDADVIPYFIKFAS